MELAVLDVCEELGIGFVAFSPLARGLFAGKIGADQMPAGDIRAAMPRFRPPHLERNLGLADRLDAIARETGCTPAQLCLAWVLSRRDYVVPAESIAAVDAICTFKSVSGPRYAREAQAQIDTEIWDGEPLD